MQRDGLSEDEHNMAEYFDLCVRYSVVAQFFGRVPTFVTQHRLCDLAFCFLMQKDKSTVRFMPDGDEFVYFYSVSSALGLQRMTCCPVGVLAFSLASTTY